MSVIPFDKNRKKQPNSKPSDVEGPKEVLYSDSESVQEIAEKLIPKYHSHLVNASIIYGCRDKAQKRAGVPSPGYVKKMTPELKWLSAAKTPNDEEANFLVVVALEIWNVLAPNQRTALVDHLLTRCLGEEDEKTGNMRWRLQPPQVQEFAEIAERHGRWNEGLSQLADSLEGK